MTLLGDVVEAIGWALIEALESALFAICASLISIVISLIVILR